MRRVGAYHQPRAGIVQRFRDLGPSRIATAFRGPILGRIASALTEITLKDLLELVLERPPKADLRLTRDKAPCSLNRIAPAS
jgi:hypothetical protein